MWLFLQLVRVLHGSIYTVVKETELREKENKKRIRYCWFGLGWSGCTRALFGVAALNWSLPYVARPTNYS
jgi:hypothetical protein